ncbi:hypothetical protein ABEF93_005185 [Exophiala dermatitidis]
MATLQAFPSLTRPEFSQACKALEDRCADGLDGTDWLSVRWTGEELLIKQNRKIQSLQHQENNNNPSNGQNPSEDDVEPIEDAEVFSETFVPPKDQCQSLTVDFSITLSPTYYVPVLWFSCQAPSSGGKPLRIEQVYDWLVPHRFRMSLGNVGVMGGISMAHHPVWDRPAFFIHPCNTHEALSVLRSDTPLTPETYLVLWIGLVGSAVGLHVPSRLVGAE